MGFKGSFIQESPQACLVNKREVGENGVKKWSLWEGRGQKCQEQVQRKKRAAICLPWKVGGEQRWGEVLEAPAPQRRGVSALVKEQGCLPTARRALCPAGSLGGRPLWQGMHLAPGTGKGSPEGKAGVWNWGQRTGWNLLLARCFEILEPQFLHVQSW